jgi:putative transposase
MARKPRIQFAGAIYHLIGRGNYRKALFDQDGAGFAFKIALGECSTRCGWKVHAYVLIKNHYHLVVETPDGNLVEGMRWLLGVFGTRFNRFRKEAGHVFQGRYNALLVEPGSSLVRVVDYVYLNLVRAKLVEVSELPCYSRSSLPKYFEGKRPVWLRRDHFLEELGLPNNARGMRSYLERFKALEEADPKNSESLSKESCLGWAIGTLGYRKALAEEFSKMTLARDWGGPELRELNEERWDQMGVYELKRWKKTEADIMRSRKGAVWKREVAVKLRRETSASNPLITERLNTGHPSYISKWLGVMPKF